MQSKLIAIEPLGSVAFQKRKGSRSLRLKVDVHGKVLVTMPFFMPYETAILFVKKHQPWIHAEQSKRTPLLFDGMLIGRVHILRFVATSNAGRPRVRVTASQIIVSSNKDSSDEEVQEAARNGAVRSLKREAGHFLPKRLADIARMEGYQYGEVAIKKLRGRWGSCSQRRDITFNCYLMQLPIELIDYVIYHELAHTVHMNHGADFWRELTSHLPNAKQLRNEIRRFQPTVPAQPMA